MRIDRVLAIPAVLAPTAGTTLVDIPPAETGCILAAASVTGRSTCHAARLSISGVPSAAPVTVSYGTTRFTDIAGIPGLDFELADNTTNGPGGALPLFEGEATLFVGGRLRIPAYAHTGGPLAIPLTIDFVLP